LLDGWKTAVKS